jgi:hypothetical protein
MTPLNVILLNVILLNCNLLNVIQLKVIMQNVILLNITLLIVTQLNGTLLHTIFPNAILLDVEAPPNHLRNSISIHFQRLHQSSEKNKRSEHESTSKTFFKKGLFKHNYFTYCWVNKRFNMRDFDLEKVFFIVTKKRIAAFKYIRQILKVIWFLLSIAKTLWKEL